MDNETEVILGQMEGTRASLAQKLETLENQVVGTLQEATSTVSETVNQVSETVNQVKDAVTDTVETVKETVEGTVDTVKETVQGTVDSVKETLDIRRQVEKHPWLMFGGAFAVGYLSAWVLRQYGPRMTPSWDGLRAAGRNVSDSFGSAFRPAAQSNMERAAAGYPDEAGLYDTGSERRKETPPPRQQEPGVFENLSSAVGPEISKLKGLAIGAALGFARDYIKQVAPGDLGSQLGELVDDLTGRLGGQVMHGSLLDNFLGRRSHDGNNDTGRAQREYAGEGAR